MQENNINNQINIPNQNYSDIDNINRRNKIIKIVLISIFFLFILIILFWFLFFKKTDTVTNQNQNTNFPNLNIGTSTGQSTYSDQNNNTENINNQESEGAYNELVHIWPKAVTGFNFINTNSTNTSNYIIFQDKDSGNIFKSEMFTYKSVRLTNTTFLNSLKSVFTDNGENVAILYFDVKDNSINPTKKLLLSKISRSENTELDTNNVIDVDVIDINTYNNKIAYIKKVKNNISELYIYDTKTESKSKIVEIPLIDLYIDWKEDSVITLKTKPTNLVDQSIINVDIKNKKIDLVNTNDKNNITNDYNKNVLALNGNVLTLYKNLFSSQKINIDMFSNPDKCVFSKDVYIYCGVSNEINNLYNINIIDDWYKGKISFNDKLKIYSLKENLYTEYDMSAVSGESLDFYKPEIFSFKNDNLNINSVIFKNKKDMSLWSLDLDYITGSE